MIQVKSNLKKIVALYEKMRKRVGGNGRGGFRLKAHRDMSVMLDRWVQLNFRSEGGKVGGWKPFRTYCVGGPRSPYIKTKTCGRGRVKFKGKRRMLDKSAKLLQDTSWLRHSFTKGLFYDKETAGIGTEVEYGEYHEQGAGHLPKRRMLPNTRDVYNDVKKIYERHLKKAIKT